MTRRSFIQTVSALFAGAAAPQLPAATATSEVRPRHVICFLGEWKSLQPVQQVVQQFGHGFSLDRESSQVGRDERMDKAFAASMDRVAPTFSDQDKARVRHHTAVAYVLSPPISRADSLDISAAALQLLGKLIKAGSTAVKSESAGLAHGLDHWLDLARQAQTSKLAERQQALREAWVRRPISEGDLLYSCGMHLLGLPDIECAGALNERDAVHWLDAMADHCLAAGVPADQFAPDGKTAARHVKALPCTRYEADDFFFNPYGYLRIQA